ncbi:sperm-associated antigen 7-like [Lineus longissimus]|uniref:sperm-associated antigen 7-like n=1 Tax=Lineus longissimus TaxID=88925 RepID=UPI002B4FA993
MADLLGSILGSMEKPPSSSDAERKKAQEAKAKQERMIEYQKDRLSTFKLKVQKQLNEFMKDPTQEKYRFQPMDKTCRALVHEMAEVAGLASFSFGQDEIDRYVMLWKKEYAPTDDELLSYRRGEEWTPEKAKEIAEERERDKLQEEENMRQKPKTKVVPVSNYKDKYEHLIGKVAAKDAAKLAMANKQYGFVSSENKRDRRTIEQVMADNKAKRQKVDGPEELTDQTGASAGSELQ